MQLDSAHLSRVMDRMQVKKIFRATDRPLFSLKQLDLAWVTWSPRQQAVREKATTFCLRCQQAGSGCNTHA